MELKNEKLLTLFNGFSHLSVDVKNNEQRRLPLLAGVRLRRTLNDLEDSAKIIQDHIQEQVDERNEKITELKDKYKAEDSDYSKEQFNEDAKAINEKLNDEIQELLDQSSIVTFSDLLTMADVKRIDETLDSGVPSGVAASIEVLEEVIKLQDADTK